MESLPSCSLQSCRGQKRGTGGKDTQECVTQYQVVSDDDVSEDSTAEQGAGEGDVLCMCLTDSCVCTRCEPVWDSGEGDLS